MRFLCIKAGASFNARRLSQYLNVSQTAIAKSLPLLEKEQLIKVEKDKESGRLAIELNKDNQKVTEFKRAENLKFIYESGLVSFLKQKFHNNEIIVFGLYSQGRDIISSDVNLAIIAPKKTLNLNRFEKLLERDIHLDFYNSVKNIDNKILREGIEL